MRVVLLMFQSFRGGKGTTLPLYWSMIFVHDRLRGVGGQWLSSWYQVDETKKF